MLSGCVWFSLMGLTANSLASDCDWQMVAIFRSGLATLFALAVVGITGAKLAFFKPGILWLRSIAGSCSMVTTFYALTHMPVSDVLTLTNTFPIWVALLSWPMVGERPTLGVWLAVVCAVLGVVLTQQPELLTNGFGQGQQLKFPLAAWAALIASVFTAVAMLGLNKIRGVSMLGVVVHFSAVATCFCVVSYFVFDRHIGTSALAEGTVLGKLLFVGAAATVGQVFLTLAFRSGSATRVSVIGLSQVAMVMAVEAMYGRQFTVTQIVGIMLILGPAAWVMTVHRKPAVKAKPEPAEDSTAGPQVAPKSVAGEMPVQKPTEPTHKEPKRVKVS